MAYLALQDLADAADDYDAAVADTEHIDRFCSSSAWVLSASEGLMVPREPWVWRSDSGWAVLARRESDHLGVCFEPFEAMWGFASPFAGPRIDDLVGEVLAELADRDDWRAVLVTGVDLGGGLAQSLARHRRPGWRLALGARTRRRRASLEGGFEGYLSRRTSGFRRNLKRARRASASAGVTFERVVEIGGDDGCDQVYERILGVEQRSWKGLRSIGIESGHMSAFYRAMLPRLARRGALRVVFARRDETDLAYHLGGTFDGSYRGLQHSFDDAHRRLSLGTVTHAHMIETICSEGLALYDLGQDSHYKARWSELTWDTHTLALLRDVPVA